MKCFKGVLAMLVLLAFAMGSFASLHSPTTQKAKHPTEFSIFHFAGAKTLAKADGNFGVMKFEAILPDVLFLPAQEDYVVLWSIGKPTGQEHESLICDNQPNAASGNHRCKASRF